MNHTTITDALAIAMRLGPKERLQLIERLVSSIESEFEALPSSDELSETEHWGKSLNKLLDEIGPIDLVDPHIEDPVQWVKHQRAKSRKKRLGSWGMTE